MSEMLYQVFLERESELVNNVIQRLKSSTARSYQQMEWESLLHRVESLVTYFMMSFRTKPAQFVDYIAEIAEVRQAADYRLKEILMALRILEELSWEITVDGVALDEQVRMLARVTGTIGAAKDRLAEIWVDHMEAEAEVARSQGTQRADRTGTTPQEV
ncbi:MAG: hypothetical protein GY838_14205 [bacterium]|nr:hypothetical protein [bacterium]